MKISEVFRIVIFNLVGFCILFLLIPWMYKSGYVVTFEKIRVDAWLSLFYKAALIIFFTSSALTLLWYLLTLKYQDDHNRSFWRLIWWGVFGFLLFVGVGNVYYFNRTKELIYETLPSMIVFLSFTSLFILYWLPTVTSTPGLLKNGVVPGSNAINAILRRR